MIIKIHRTLHVEKPEDYTHITHKLKLIKEFSKVTGYRINIQEPAAFLCAENRLSKKKIKKTIPVKLASKIIKYFICVGVSLTKEVKELYTENYKTLIKEIRQK